MQQNVKCNKRQAEQQHRKKEWKTIHFTSLQWSAIYVPCVWIVSHFYDTLITTWAPIDERFVCLYCGTKWNSDIDENYIEENTYYLWLTRWYFAACGSNCQLHGTTNVVFPSSSLSLARTFKPNSFCYNNKMKIS